MWPSEQVNPTCRQQLRPLDSQDGPKAVSDHWNWHEASDSYHQCLGWARVGRLQAHVEPRGLRRCQAPTRPLSKHLVARHCPLQQVRILHTYTNGYLWETLIWFVSIPVPTVTTRWPSWPKQFCTIRARCCGTRQPFTSPAARLMSSTFHSTSNSAGWSLALGPMTATRYDFSSLKIDNLGFLSYVRLHCPHAWRPKLCQIKTTEDFQFPLLNDHRLTCDTSTKDRAVPRSRWA